MGLTQLDGKNGESKKLFQISGYQEDLLYWLLRHRECGDKRDLPACFVHSEIFLLVQTCLSFCYLKNNSLAGW